VSEVINLELHFRDERKVKVPISVLNDPSPERPDFTGESTPGNRSPKPLGC
jgi:hypothetical protein